MIAWLLLERHRRSLAETEARNRRREAIHLNRVATATVLSSSIAHELSQPLASILINTETARKFSRRVPQTSSARWMTFCPMSSGTISARATLSMRQRDFLKKDRICGLQLFDLNDSVREVVRIAASEASKRGVALSADRSSEVLPVRADRIQMQQVMLNLVMNGMDALENRDPAAREVIIHVSRGAAPEAVEVTVSDSETGFPKAS